MSLRIQLIVFSSLIGVLAALATAGVVSSITASSLEEDTLRQYQNSLTGKRTLTAAKVTEYFSTIEKQITSMAFDQSTRKAMQRFESGFANYESERQGEPPEASLLQAYYLDEFGPAYRDRNQANIDIEGLYRDLPSVALTLQHDFIAANPHPRGSKDGLITPDSVTSYSADHAIYHSSFQQFLTTFGYYDIFLVDMRGNVVYSVFKELDYATNLVTGPYKNSGIAEAFSKARDLPAGNTYLTDFTSYVPSYNDSASFIATPIFDGDNQLGVLIYQMPIAKLNNIMTQNQDWVATGFGESGEVYLVGPDKLLRNESRFFVEDPKAYLSLLESRGIEAFRKVAVKDTSIAIQPADSPGVRDALAGKSGFKIFDDYRGVSVLSSYSPIQLGNKTWAILSEVDEAEAFIATNNILASIFTWTIGVLVGISVLAICLATLLANRTTRPLAELAQRLKDLAMGEADLTQRVPAMKIPEINQIAEGFNSFMARLQESIDRIKVASQGIARETKELTLSVSSVTESSTNQAREIATISSSMASFVEAISKITNLTIEANSETTTAGDSAANNTERAELAAQNISQLVNEVSASVQTIQSLQAQVKEISDVLAIINSIADQTNLLALNAAIEAGARRRTWTRLCGCRR